MAGSRRHATIATPAARRTPTRPARPGLNGHVTDDSVTDGSVTDAPNPRARLADARLL